MPDGPKVFFRCTAKFKQDLKVALTQRGTSAQAVLQAFAERYLMDPQTLDRALSDATVTREHGVFGLTETEKRVVEFLRSAGTGELADVELSMKRTLLDNLRALKRI